MATKAKTFTLATESLLRPLPKQKAKDRRAWSIPINEVWVPYFTAMKVAGKVDMADETLGAPLRQAFEKDGTPKFSEKGTPVIRTARELNDAVRAVQQHFVDDYLVADAATVQRGDPAAFKAQLEASHKAGQVVLQADADRVMRYMAAVESARAAVEAAHAQDNHAEPAPTHELVAA